MERLPCDMGGENKKSEWTPEEDLILVSYIQQKGQQKGTDNWSSVPNDTGLKRCSESCRLRWFNHLRPGLNRGNFTTEEDRGNFTTEEDRMIINLHALLGNQWSVIAHYLPGRTDNDIENYWNTHLEVYVAKKATFDALKKLCWMPSQAASQNTPASTSSTTEPYVFNCENVAVWLQKWNKQGDT